MGVLLSEGRFDLLPDHSMRWGPPGPEEFPFEAASFAATLCQQRSARVAQARAGGKTDRNLPRVIRHMPFLDIPLGAWHGPRRRRYRDVRYAEAIEGLSHVQALWAANTIRTDGSQSGVFLSAGTLHGPPRRYLYFAIVIAGGDVTVAANSGVSDCIIVCDGAVTTPHASKSVIIARKGIVIKDKKDSVWNVLSSCGNVTVPEGVKKHQLIEEDTRRPLGLVRFFAVSDVGLTLDALSVKAIDPKCPLASAGLRKGDAFVSIDGKATKDAEGLRRALRRRFAIAGLGSFTVKRGGKTLTLRARLAE
jgi:membrane-associated protease RseP (regulator of RpoE activity)